MSGRGKMISFEGIDGSGKTTISGMLFQKMEKEGLPIYYTFEPTYTRVGSIIHKVIRGDMKASPAFLALMFASDRLRHFEDEIWPTISRGTNVIVDRYIHSSIAYQGTALGDEKWIRVLNNRVPPPDLGIYIDIEPREAMKRLIGMKKFRKPTIFERVEFLAKVRRAYKELVKNGELVEIDGNQSKQVILACVRKTIASRLGI